MMTKSSFKIIYFFVFFMSIFSLSVMGVDFNLQVEDNISKLVEKLPEGVQIDTTNKNTIKYIDIDKDGREEIFLAYKLEKIESAVFLSEFKYINNDYKLIQTYKGDGYDIDFLDFADIDGHGQLDLLFGVKIGSAWGKLNVFDLNKSKEKIFAVTYSKIELLKHGEYNNKSKQVYLAIWSKDTGEAYKVDILKWKDNELIAATDAYKAYYKVVVDFYEKKTKEMPEAAFYWYYLADAQFKTGDKKAALDSISKGVALDSNYPPRQKFEELKKDIIKTMH